MFPLRDENPRHGTPIVTMLLILASTLVFVHQLRLGYDETAFVLKYALIPVQLTSNVTLPTPYYGDNIPALLTLVTSMFLHGGWMHFLGNMWFLWIFGDNIEDALGHVAFLLFYLATGIAAGLCHVSLNASSQVPTLGASGAISGVLGAYIVLFPRIRIQTIFILGFFIQRVRVPALFFLGLWFLMQLMGGFASQAGAGIAFGAHIGGFVAGLVLVHLVSRRRPAEGLYRYEARRLRRW